MRKALFVALLLLTTMLMAKPHILFKDGKSVYQIVCATDAHESEQVAARELQTWIAEVSGVTLPIVHTSAGKRGQRLVVGFNSVATSLLPDSVKPQPGSDAFTYCNVAGDIVIWGGERRGTLYGVYAFLENELGIRWWTSKVSLAPKQPTWSFNSLNHHEEPGLIMRYNCYYDAFEPYFAARTRNNHISLPALQEGKTLPGTCIRYWNAHTMGQIVPAAKYFDKHPEYFSEIDGKRIKDYTQLCLSNPEVLQLCIEGMRRAMRKEPDNLVYSLSQNDWLNPCSCAKCQALVDQYGGQSGILLWFVNQVADAIHDEFPDKYIGTFAYQYTRKPPTGIVPRKNVVIRLCSIECCLLHDYDQCELNRNFMTDLQQWSAIAPNLYIWDYDVSFTQYCMPLPNLMNIQSHIQDFRTHHAIGLMEEGNYQCLGGEMEELRTYLVGKLLWNPDADVKAIIREFTDGYYGKAGAIIREYLDYEHAYLRRDGIHQDCFPRPNAAMYTEEFIARGRSIFARARHEVKDNPELLARVEKAELPLCFLQLDRTPEKRIDQGALVLMKRVVERENIDRIAEWGGYIHVQDFFNQLERRTRPYSGNPILPEFHADPEVLYSNKTGRYYIYSTTDGAPGWGGYYFTVFSSENLTDWRHEGIMLDLGTDQVSWASGNAWAPCIEEKKQPDGSYKFYFYYSGHDIQRNRKSIGVAVSDSPTGPFTDLGHPIVYDRPAGVRGGQQIDVDVFTDPVTGKSFLYWGNGYMAGAELNEDMVSLKDNTITVMTPKGGTLQDYNYREGTYVFYRDGKYYFMWSVDDTGSPNYHVAYGTSDSPLGPIQVAENPVVLIQNPEKDIYGPAHNSILQIPGKDEWYIVYHRINKGYLYPTPSGPGFHRQVCIDKLEFNSNGTIRPVIPTQEGVRALERQPKP